MNRSRQTIAAALLVAGVTAACGQKGPPLPPLRPLPVSPTEVAARRVGDQVHLRFVLPTTNQDPAAPLSLSRVDIYARSLGYGSERPVMTQLVHRDFLVGSIAVRPAPAADAPPPDPAAPVDPGPAPGEVATFSERLPLNAVRPLSLTREQQIASAARRPLPLVLPPTALAVPFTRIVLPARYYVVVPVSAQGRNGVPSAMIPVRLGASPAVPTDAVLTPSESALTLTWTSPAGSGALIYETTREGVEASAPVQPTPISTGTWSTPVVFGVEKCYSIRQVHVDGPVTTESAPAGPICVTAQDTYAPAVPTALRAVGDTGRVVLVWNAVSAPDLAGYQVLRAEAAGGELQPLTTDVVPSNGYVDTTTRAGVEYVYAVVALDKAGNRSAASAPATATGKQP